MKILSKPLNYRLYLRKEFLGKKSNKLFRSKPELAKLLINEFAPVTEITYLFIDAWYTSADIILHALSKRYHTIGRVKRNRVIYPAGIKTNLAQFSKVISKNKACPVTVGDQAYYIYRYEGTINDVENTLILFSWARKDLSDIPAYIICTDITLSNETIGQYFANRWDIEVSYRYHKTTLGFDEFQVGSLTSIKRFWSMVYMTYSFLELYRALNKRKLKF